MQHEHSPPGWGSAGLDPVVAVAAIELQRALDAALDLLEKRGYRVGLAALAIEGRLPAGGSFHGVKATPAERRVSLVELLLGAADQLARSPG